MDFNTVKFIKAHATFDKESREYAPLFRKKFSIEEKIDSAKLYVCGIGYGYHYINGKSVSEDLFTAPVSEYQKTVWYNTYDVKELLCEGENIFASELGNGWYNEAMKTVWDQNEYGVRDVPKLKMALEVNGKVILCSDDSFKCSPTSAVTYNQLRTGEVFDARLYDKNWNTLAFDDSDWQSAIIDNTPPKGIMRECTCEPIRECEEYAPVSIKKLPDGCYLFDFGLNMSGYVRIRTKQKAGDVITLKFGEDADENGCVEQPIFNSWFPDDKFQTDIFICSDEELDRKPKFTYHGFRYVHAEGLDHADESTLTAYFVHQDVERRGYFECSDNDLNHLFEAGIRATYSNVFYMPTDCPTREKYGWMNDAQSSMEQFLTDFKLENLLAKWWQDIADSMLDSGMLPGVVPPYHRAYEWGNGPVSEGTFFEIPHRVYLHTKDKTLLTTAIPYFEHILSFWKGLIEKDGEIKYGLWDWTTPIKPDYVSQTVINDIFMVKFLRIYRLALSVSGYNTDKADEDLEYFTKRVKEKYIGEGGECNVNKQTAVAMLIYYDLYDDIAPLAAQLKRLIEEKDMHHDCGMVGIRFLYLALNKIGLQEYGYKILTQRTFPSYLAWLDHGATTLYEMWNIDDPKCSRNHHMFSDFMSWLMKTVIGINRKAGKAGFDEVDIKPYFFEDLDYAKGSVNTTSGKISVDWKKDGEKVLINITLPEGVSGNYGDKKLTSGTNLFEVSLDKN